VLDCGDLDIDFRAATQQVRPRTQSTITGGLGQGNYKIVRYADDS